jgi:adenosylcobinamide kinase/adenosylcobinamide-phosphate guanylyltransferase
MGFTLVIGGARSGKSAMAQRLAEQSGRHVTVIVTGQPRDEEMQARILRHQRDRPGDWSTVEAPLDITAAIAAVPAADFLLLDCLTLWVANLLEQDADEEQIHAAARQIVGELQHRDAAVVTNEVGLGAIPMSELGRRFGDVLGRVNAVFAESAERAVLMVAGKALDLASADIVLGRG